MMKKIISSLLLIFIIQFSFSQEEKVTQVFFIRHAEKVKDGSDDPALTKLGEQRATYWAEVFKNIDFDAVYSTQTIRTTSTALPSAIQSEVEISIYDSKELDIVQLASEHLGKSILIVGHSNTTPFLVNKLIGEDKFEEIERYNNSNLYIVSLNGEGKNVSLLYIESKQ